MKNVCKRNCLWKYDNQCCAEDIIHYQDGTVFTKKCSMYINENFEENIGRVIICCQDLLWGMNDYQLKKAKYLLNLIKKDKKIILYTDEEILQTELATEEVVCKNCTVDNDEKDCSSCELFYSEREKHIHRKD